MKNLTKKAKIALGSAGAGILALTVALGVWQPWKAPADQSDTDQLQSTVLPPVDESQEEEKGPVLTVGGKEIPCTIFEGDGWQIYVPEEWTVDAGENGGIFAALAENGEQAARLEVIRSIPAAYEGSFISISPQRLSDTEEWRLRSFYTGTAEGAWEVTCQAPVENWDEYQRLMTAMARTMTVGEEMPFSGMFPVADEPDWQITEGDTLLWMDKDAYIVDDEVEEFVSTQMLAWDSGKKVSYTGQFWLDDLTWAGSYTCLPGEEYVDVFRTGVWYEIAPGGEENILLGDNMSIQNGWLHEGFSLYVVVCHDGSAVSEVCILHSNDTVPGHPGFAADLMG